MAEDLNYTSEQVAILLEAQRQEIYNGIKNYGAQYWANNVAKAIINHIEDLRSY